MKTVSSGRDTGRDTGSDTGRDTAEMPRTWRQRDKILRSSGAAGDAWLVGWLAGWLAGEGHARQRSVYMCTYHAPFEDRPMRDEYLWPCLVCMTLLALGANSWLLAQLGVELGEGGWKRRGEIKDF
jgi:hypothetical protein